MRSTPNPPTFTLFNGRLRLQDAKPRPSEDPLWLAAAMPLLPPKQRLLDAGCGSGVLALALNLFQPGHFLTLLDNNPRCLDLARANAALNRQSTAAFIAADFLTFRPSQPWDIILANPPFHLAALGHTSPSPVLRQRHQALPKFLENWLLAALTHTTSTGHLGFVLHTTNLPLLKPLCAPYAVQILPLASHPTRAPKRALFWLSKSGQPAWQTSPPLPIHHPELREKTLRDAQRLPVFS